VPYINPDVQLAEIHAQDAHKKGSRSTPETWIVAALMAAAAITWITLTVTRSHHTSAVAPNPATTASAVPR
jgi:hypothetical protein